jgi:hypothetical protein
LRILPFSHSKLIPSRYESGLPFASYEILLPLTFVSLSFQLVSVYSYVLPFCVPVG